MTESWWHFVALLGAPGDFIANAYGGDWQEDEAWSYRSDITLWSGVFWTSVSLVGVFVFRFVKTRMPLEDSRPV